MKILLATDGSEYSDRAAQFLANLNLSADDEITVLHVITDVPFRNNMASYHPGLRQIMQEIAPEIIRTTIDILRPLNTKIKSLSVDDYPGKGIIDTAEDLNVDMIVMGAKGLKGIKRILIGSVTRFVAINSSKPVLVVKTPLGEQSDNLKILFATDGSSYAKETGSLLISMPFHNDAEITVLQVIQSGLDIPEKFNVKIDEKMKKTLTEIKSLALKESEKTFEQACNFIGDRFTKVNCFTKDGDPSLEILNAAKELKTDIIAVGSKGMRGIKGMLGSVSRYILGHSECSVLIGKTGE
jgi:nucleotide-binding universal stress UspA family protein